MGIYNNIYIFTLKKTDLVLRKLGEGGRVKSIRTEFICTGPREETQNYMFKAALYQKKE